MEWLTALRGAIDCIEAHLEDELTLEDVARKVYVSPHYLAKGFQIVTGYTIAEYIRDRRLYCAALALTETKDTVLEIAYRFGYDTPESFSKAFARFHGATPKQVRAEGRPIRRFLPMRINIHITGGNDMKVTISPAWPMKFIGFERIFDEESAKTGIPAFWDEICERFCAHTIYAGYPASCPEEQAIIDNCIGEYGVCVDDLPGGRFRYLIAGRYAGGSVPEGMTLVELPQGQWAKFTTNGPVPESIQALNRQIFTEWLPGNPDWEQNGAWSIEWYSCDGEKTDADYASGVWLPVRARKQ